MKPRTVPALEMVRNPPFSMEQVTFYIVDGDKRIEVETPYSTEGYISMAARQQLKIYKIKKLFRLIR